MLTFWHNTIYRISTNLHTLAPFILHVIYLLQIPTRVDRSVLESQKRLTGLCTIFSDHLMLVRNIRSTASGIIRERKTWGLQYPTVPNTVTDMERSQFSKVIVNAFITMEVEGVVHRAVSLLPWWHLSSSPSLWNNLCFLDRGFFFLFGNIFKILGNLSKSSRQHDLQDLETSRLDSCMWAPLGKLFNVFESQMCCLQLHQASK